MIPRKRLDSSMELYAGTRNRGEPDPWELLLELLTRIEEAVRGVTVGTIRSTETYYTARDALKQHDAERSGQ